ncbi:MAG: ABC transporter substrate-binding protein [Sphingobacteriales bacterium]|nr:ABC transporter substrate-binding protein [Sphingobacteriales bacterium]
MKKSFIYLVSFLSLLSSVHSFAQNDSAAKTIRVGLFAPIYLDSVFANGQYKYKDQMPKIVIPGLDFVEGAQIALDSIKTTTPLSVSVYDYKSADQNISQLILANTFDSLDIIIGSVGSAEFKQLADIAAKKNIPFISATYPNDGGITANPNTIILNATLNTHCSGIYNYIVKYLPGSKITLFKKQGVVEERIAAQFSKLNTGNTGNPLLNIPAILLKDSFDISIIESKLDSTRTNTIIAGTLDENFGKRIASFCAVLSKKYNINLIGMPNWDGIKDFSKPDYKNLSIFYSASFYTDETDKWSTSVKTVFKDRTNGTAMDMVYKGFESTYYFLSLLLKNKIGFMNNLNDKSFKVFTDYDIKPVRNTGKSATPDYFENKKVYIIKKLNGVITKML